MFKRLLITLSILATFVSVSMAKEQAIELGEVVVTATKEEKEIKDIPVSADVITKDEIEKMRVIFADEAIKYEPGVYVKHSKFGDTMSKSTLRGFSDPGGTLVILDGQPLNDGYNSKVTWAAIPMENIERIEIIKGPYSSLYGKCAMGGVINIITQTPKNEAFSLKTSAAPNNTSHHALNYANKMGKFSFSLNFAKIQTDGERTELIVKTTIPGTSTTKVYGWTKTKTKDGKDAYLIGDTGRNYWDQNQYNGKLTYCVNPATNLSFSYLHSNYEYGYKDPQTYLTDATGKPVDNGKIEIAGQGTISITPKDFFSSWGRRENNAYHLNLETLIKGIRVKASCGLNKQESFYVQPDKGANIYGGAGKLSKTSPNSSINIDLLSQIPIAVQNTLLTLGMNLREDDVKVQEWKVNNWKDENSKSPTTPDLIIKGKARTEALYAQVETELMEKLTLFSGTRYDTWQNYDALQFEKTKTITYTKKEKSSLSTRIGIVFKPDWETKGYKLERIKASYGKAFNPPDVYSLYRTWTFLGKTYESNPNLNPETSKSYELGIDQSMGKINLTYTLFQSKIEDLIYSKSIDSKLKRKENAGEGKISGFEISTKLKILPSLKVFGNYTLSDTEITSNLAATNTVGKKFQNVPKKMSNVGLLWAPKEKIDIFCIWHYIDKVYTEANNSDTEKNVYGSFDPVNSVNVKLMYKVKDELNLSLAIDNLFDKEYYSYYKAPGKTLTVEARYKY